jgi:hypothetical protein
LCQSRKKENGRARKKRNEGSITTLKRAINVRCQVGSVQEIKMIARLRAAITMMVLRYS